MNGKKVKPNPKPPKKDEKNESSSSKEPRKSEKPPPGDTGDVEEQTSTDRRWDEISSHPDLKQMMEDQTIESADMGTFRVCVKPQSKRSPIAVLMQKNEDDKKFTQKAQIVVKDSVLAVDAMCILKLITIEIIEKTVKMNEIKTRKDDLLRCLEDCPQTLLLSMESSHPRSKPENVDFLDCYQRRIELEYRDPPEGSLSFVFCEMLNIIGRLSGLMAETDDRYRDAN